MAPREVDSQMAARLAAVRDLAPGMAALAGARFAVAPSKAILPRTLGVRAVLGERIAETPAAEVPVVPVVTVKGLLVAG